MRNLRHAHVVLWPSVVAWQDQPSGQQSFAFPAQWRSPLRPSSKSEQKSFKGWAIRALWVLPASPGTSLQQDGDALSFGRPSVCAPAPCTVCRDSKICDNKLTTGGVVGDLVALAGAARRCRGSSLAEAASIVVVVVVGRRAARGGQPGPGGARGREVVGRLLGRLAEVAAARLPACD